MKRTAVLLMLLCMLTVTASAAYVPEDVVSENRDGRQLIIKTYTLPPDADPSELIEEPFELEGYTYHHLETVKEEQAFKDSKAQTEVVTLETNTDDLAKILEQLAPTMEYNKDGYSGTLTLDHTTIQTEAAGYKLCFLLEREGGRIDAFGVLPVEPGRESITGILLAQQPQDVTVLLFLTSLEQHQLLHLRQRHYFVIRQEGRLRFFKGGDARQ